MRARMQPPKDERQTHFSTGFRRPRQKHALKNRSFRAALPLLLPPAKVKRNEHTQQPEHWLGTPEEQHVRSMVAANEHEGGEGGTCRVLREIVGLGRALRAHEAGIALVLSCFAFGEGRRPLTAGEPPKCRQGHQSKKRRHENRRAQKKR